MNEMVSCLAENVPVIALQAFGIDAGMWRLTGLSEHVSCGLPLLFVDCRKRVVLDDAAEELEACS